MECSLGGFALIGVDPAGSGEMEAINEKPKVEAPALCGGQESVAD